MSIPEEPSSDMRQLASIIRNAYVALVQEGFTEHQALIIVGQMIARSS